MIRIEKKSFRRSITDLKNTIDNRASKNISVFSEDESKQIKGFIIQNIHKFGLPREFFKDKIKVTIGRVDFNIDIEELNIVDLYRFQDKAHPENANYPTPHILHLCTQPLKILAEDATTKELKLLTLQHKTATIVLDEFYRLYEAYIEEMNKLVDAIYSLEIKNNSDVDKLIIWMFPNFPMEMDSICFS